MIVQYFAGKNSNETAPSRNCPTLQPYQGRNPCMERNLMLASDSQDDLGRSTKVLVDRSSKHVSKDQQYKLHTELQSLVTHEYSTRAPQLASAPRSATPIPYVQNVITENGILHCNKRKQTNMEEGMSENPRRKKFAGWTNLKRLLTQKKMYPYAKCRIDREDSKSNLLTRAPVKIVDTNVTISAGGKYINGVVSKSSSSESIPDKNENISRARENFAARENTENSDNPERPSSLSLVNLNLETPDFNLTRRESLDKFNQVFNRRSNSIPLKHPNMRIKTPGDLPPSVRKVRGRAAQNTARFSLYDDRMMCNFFNDNDDSDDKNISSSVPFGIDRNDDPNYSSNTKNVTCF